MTIRIAKTGAVIVVVLNWIILWVSSLVIIADFCFFQGSFYNRQNPAWIVSNNTVINNVHFDSQMLEICRDLNSVQNVCSRFLQSPCLCIGIPWNMFLTCAVLLSKRYYLERWVFWQTTVVLLRFLSVLLVELFDWMLGGTITSRSGYMFFICLQSWLIVTMIPICYFVHCLPIRRIDDRRARG